MQKNSEFILKGYHQGTVRRSAFILVTGPKYKSLRLRNGSCIGNGFHAFGSSCRSSARMGSI